MMKRSIQIQFLFLSLALILTVAGCKTRPKGITRIPGGSGNIGGPGPEGAIDPGLIDPGPGFGSGGNTSPGGFQEKPLPPYEDVANMREDRTALADYTVHFGFDSSTIASSEDAKIESVANYLRSNPAHKVRVEGHCDERGTEQYNLGLGDRRATSVREYLINLGISWDRVVATSFGEELPFCDGMTEACYAQNRRGEFVVLTPP